jgi:hypothetical protein
MLTAFLCVRASCPLFSSSFPFFLTCKFRHGDRKVLELRASSPNPTQRIVRSTPEPAKVSFSIYRSDTFSPQITSDGLPSVKDERFSLLHRYPPPLHNRIPLILVKSRTYPDNSKSHCLSRWYTTRSCKTRFNNFLNDLRDFPTQWFRFQDIHNRTLS